MLDISLRSKIKQKSLLKMIGIHKGKFYEWKIRMGVKNRHNSSLPKSNWLLPWEKEAIAQYARKHYSENDYFLRDGYRRLTYRTRTWWPLALQVFTEFSGKKTC